MRRSILLDCKADLLVYGMGESAILEIAERLQAGETVKDLRDMRGGNCLPLWVDQGDGGVVGSTKD